MKRWKISDYYQAIRGNRILLHRVFFTLALISLALDFYYHILLSQIGPNPLFFQDLDPTYLLFMSARIPQIVSAQMAPWFDALIIVSCIACIILPRIRIFPLLFFILHFIYFITYNMLSGHHYIDIGLLVMSFPFIFYNDERFASMLFMCRLVLCFMMFSAACWKIVRGNLWYPDQTNILLISTYTKELMSSRPSAMVNAVKWFIRHRALSHGLWCALILLEAIFAAGFFTFKWDRILLISYLLFFAGGWIIFKIYNYDNLLFLLTLAPVLHYLRRRRTAI